MPSADFVRVNGLGIVFHSLIHLGCPLRAKVPAAAAQNIPSSWFLQTERLVYYGGHDS
jgi:hypothetical protein